MNPAGVQARLPMVLVAVKLVVVEVVVVVIQYNRNFPCRSVWVESSIPDCRLRSGLQKLS